MEKTTNKKRILGLDIIRVIAVILVFVTHAINYRGLMLVNQKTFHWTLYMILRFLAMACVPLFMLLTGYLNTKKEISKKYYQGLIPLLFSYIGISILELVGTAVYQKTPFNIQERDYQNIKFFC